MDALDSQQVVKTDAVCLYLSSSEHKSGLYHLHELEINRKSVISVYSYHHCEKRNVALLGEKRDLKSSGRALDRTAFYLYLICQSGSEMGSQSGPNNQTQSVRVDVHQEGPHLGNMEKMVVDELNHRGCIYESGT